MTYQNIRPATFLARPNRFVAQVELDGRIETAHVKNTGRCRELLTPGATVFLEHNPHPGRKTAYSLVAVDKGGLLINMDSQAPNQVIAEAFGEGWRPRGLAGEPAGVRREVRRGDSRFDFAFEAGGIPALMEVKGVTLEEAGRTYFPDAPTQRGVKHIQHLIRAREEGMGAWLIFVVQMDRALSLAPNDRTHPAFGAALRAAEAAGVGLRAYRCAVTPGSIRLGEEIPVLLDCPLQTE